MAVLSDAQRAALAARIMQAASESRTPINLLKAEVEAAVAASDAWMDANAASFNGALPTAARNNLSPAQKAWLLKFVADARYIVTGA